MTPASGGATYERFAKTWSGSDRRPPYIARLGAMPNYLFSSKVEAAEWNQPTIVRGDVVAEVAYLEQQAGGPLLLLVHGLLGETLLRHGLLDVLELTIHPVVVGRGKPLFREAQAANLRPATITTYAKLVRVTYEIVH